MEAELQHQRFDKELLIPTDEICQKLTGTFDVIACIRLLREKALIQTSGANPVYVRGVLYDAAGHMILLVWGDMIDTTTEKGNSYCFTQLSLKNCFGRNLATSKMSVATSHKSSQDFPTLDEAVLKC